MDPAVCFQAGYGPAAPRLVAGEGAVDQPGVVRTLPTQTASCPLGYVAGESAVRHCQAALRSRVEDSTPVHAGHVAAERAVGERCHRLAGVQPSPIVWSPPGHLPR